MSDPLRTIDDDELFPLLLIDSYGYEIWRGEEKLSWYDSQPHPDEPALQATHPHHKHVPPDMKHNCVPAANVSFGRPNLPALVAEVEALVRELAR